VVDRDDAATLREALKGTRLDLAPPGFKTAPVSFFGMEDAASFALADGDEGIVLGVRHRGLLVITSEQDDDHRWSARIGVVPMDEVELEVEYFDPRTPSVVVKRRLPRPRSHGHRWSCRPKRCARGGSRAPRPAIGARLGVSVLIRRRWDSPHE
jgi:hypothetical protein